jgi:large subunit ribosomal protein L9
MKVVLLKDVAGVGRKNEVKSVSDGYALNMLIPKKLAMAGTAASIAHAERLASEAAAERKVQEDLLFKNLLATQGVVIEMTGKANEQGHLFASVQPSAIVAELKKQKGIDLLPEFLQITKPVKELGEHAIPVSVHGKAGAFTLLVKAAP